MAEIEPIRIFHADSVAAVRARHARIEDTLNQLGAENVRARIGLGFPTNWDPIINAWLAGGRLAKPKVE